MGTNPLDVNKGVYQGNPLVILCPWTCLLFSFQTVKNLTTTMKTYYKKALLILVSRMIISCSASSNYTMEASPTNNTEISLQPNTAGTIDIRECSLYQDMDNLSTIIYINGSGRCETRQRGPLNKEYLETDGIVCRILTEIIDDFYCRNIIIVILNNGLTESISIKVQVHDIHQGTLKALVYYNVTFLPPATTMETPTPTTTVTTDAPTVIVSAMNPVPIIANNYSAIALFVALSVALGVIVLLAVSLALVLGGVIWMRRMRPFSSQSRGDVEMASQDSQSGDDAEMASQDGNEIVDPHQIADVL